MKQRLLWIETLEDIKALNPQIVVGGHKKPSMPDGPAQLDFTIEYLRFYDETLVTSTSSADFQSKIKERYPDLDLEVILQIAADAAFQ